jgi:hypothetical protein
MGVAVAGVFGRARKELARLPMIAGALEVLRRFAEEGHGACGTAAGEPGRHLGVAVAAHALEHGVIGDVMQDLVLEGVFPQPVELGLRVRDRQLASRQAGEMLRGNNVDGGERLIPEDEADHGGLLHCELLGGFQPVEPGL